MGCGKRGREEREVGRWEGRFLRLREKERIRGQELIPLLRPAEEARAASSLDEATAKENSTTTSNPQMSKKSMNCRTTTMPGSTLVSLLLPLDHRLSGCR